MSNTDSTVNNRKYCDIIKNKLYNDYYNVDKYLVKNPLTNSVDEFSTLDEALEKQKQIKEDFYKLLDVERNASEAEIKKSYKRLAMKYHPDRNKDNYNGSILLLSFPLLHSSGNNHISPNTLYFF